MAKFDSGLFHGTSGSPQTTIDSLLSGSESSGTSVREGLMAQATTDQGRAIVNELFRPGASVGNGGTADAIRHERAQGTASSPGNHVRKGKERVRQIEKLLRRNPSHPDAALLRSLLDNLKDALKGL